MPYGYSQKRTYWVIVDRNLDIMGDGAHQLWGDYGECVQWFYKVGLSEKEYKIIKWTPMIKPENWK